MERAPALSKVALQKSSTIIIIHVNRVERCQTTSFAHTVTMPKSSSLSRWMMTHVGLTTVEITPMVRLGPHVGRSPSRRKRLQAAYNGPYGADLTLLTCTSVYMY